ncbi:hypothetical protein DQF64_04335 [Moraxella bovis]|nr:hypothetical protein DQF64_04335 [Moraxella bovis]
MDLEFDPNKEKINIQKHDIDFDEANLSIRRPLCFART